MSVKTVVMNKQASFLYHLQDKFEAGVVLKGSEVKSLREGRCHLKDAYISFSKNEAFLQKAHISPYKGSLDGGHKPERLRKLLLHKREIDKIQGFVDKKNVTCVPLKIYFKNQTAKVEIALAVRKTKGDKRQSLKKKTDQRKIERALRKKR